MAGSITKRSGGTESHMLLDLSVSNGKRMLQIFITNYVSDWPVKFEAIMADENFLYSF